MKNINGQQDGRGTNLSIAGEFSRYIARDKDADTPEKSRRIKIEAGKKSFRVFCNLINPAFFKPERKYQTTVCEAFNALYERRLYGGGGRERDILIVSLPPGFGKSYTAQLFAAWALGKNPKNQIITVSYMQDLAIDFSKNVRNTIQAEAVPGDLNDFVTNSFFPRLKIKKGDGAMDKWAVTGSYMSYLGTSFAGRLTGMRGNIMIIDDPIRDAQTALNDSAKDGIWDFYKNTFLSRKTDGAIEIIIQTRWATDDLAGRVIETFGDRVYVLSLPALLTQEYAAYEGEGGIHISGGGVEPTTGGHSSPLQGGETGGGVNLPIGGGVNPAIGGGALLPAGGETGGERVSLCEDVYSTRDLLIKRASIDAHIWSANFMQTPIDIKGALYGEFKTYAAVDADRFERRIAYIDTADEGADFLCAVIGGVIGKYGYVTEVYYTDAAMEITEGETARKLRENGTREAIVESNNGGRGFARNVETKLRETGGKRCAVTWFHQSKNKRTRILVNAAAAIEQIIFPEGWKERWGAFYKAITSYQRKGKNARDDAPDALTGFVEVINGDVKGRKKALAVRRGRFGL